MGNFLTCGHFGYTPHLINKQGSEEGGYTCTYMYMYCRKIRRGRERGEQDMEESREGDKEGRREREQESILYCNPPLFSSIII